MKKLFLSLIIFIIFPFFINSQNWLPLDKGLQGGVTQLLADTSDNMIYAVGSFKKVGNPDSLRGVAKWDGIKWNSVGSVAHITSDQRFGIYKYRDTLIISGIYNEWPNPSLLKLCGNSWETFPNTTGVHTNCFAEKDGILYFGGAFYACGNDSTYGLGKYDGTSFSGLTPCYQADNVYFGCMAFYQDTLYVGGTFYLNPPYFTPPTAGFAKWNGHDLVNVNSEFSLNGCTVETMVVYNNELYIGGFFTKSSGFTGDFIMKWDGHQFSEVGGGTNQRVTCMKVYNNELYVGGWFNEVGGVVSKNIAKWDGNQWTSLNNDDFDDFYCIRDICIFNDELYVAGNFFKIGNDSIRTIAKLNHPLTSIKKNAVPNPTLLIKPNPAFDFITIEFTNLVSDISCIRIFDSFGKEIKEYKNLKKASTFNIDISHLNSGIYYLQVIDIKGNLYSNKFVKL